MTSDSKKILYPDLGEPKEQPKNDHEFVEAEVVTPDDENLIQQIIDCYKRGLTSKNTILSYLRARNRLNKRKFYDLHKMAMDEMVEGFNYSIDERRAISLTRLEAIDDVCDRNDINFNPNTLVALEKLRMSLDGTADFKEPEGELDDSSIVATSREQLMSFLQQSGMKKATTVKIEGKQENKDGGDGQQDQKTEDGDGDAT